MILVALSALAACTGGQPGAVSIPSGQAAPTPPPAVPTLAPATAATSVPLAASATAQPVSIPPAAGLSGTLTLPAATIPPGTTLDVETTTVQPSGVPAPASSRRVPAALRAPATSSGLEVLYYQGVRFSQTVTFPGFPAFTIALPNGYDPTVGTYGLAFYDGASWQWPIGPTGAATGPQQLSFPSQPGPVTYQANQLYFFALYYAAAAPSPTPSPVPTAAPSTAPTAVPTAAPTAAPSASPSPTPGPLSASPSSLQFVGTGAALAQTLTISSSFYAGAYSANPTCTDAGGNTIATVTAGANSGQFSVAPVAPGQCTITVTDAGGRTIAVNVAVATSTLTVQSRKH